ncbi:MAG: P-II family nitrogen regulator [Treponema sp.]
MTEYSLLIILVPYGHSRKIIHVGRTLGLRGATTAIAYGTVKSKLLDFLGINQIRKELIFSIGEQRKLVSIIEALDKKYRITRKNFGIAFMVPVSICNRVREPIKTITQEEMQPMKSAIFTIVNRGCANEVVDASVAAGARGGTILNARGSGMQQAAMIFDIEIEPEKEIVLTIVDTDKTDTVVDAIRRNSNVEQDGHGILFVLPISHSYGIK